MKKIYKTSNAKRLAAYSAMAAILAPVTQGHAEVIYDDIDDVIVEIGDVYDIDIDGDAVLDFHFRASFVSSSGGSVWSFATAFGFYSSVGNSSNQVIGYPGPYYNYASFLESGAEIGPKGPWLNYPSYSNHAVLASNFYGVTYGAFPGQGEGFMGIQFKIGENLHYGWMRLESDIDQAYVTLMDLAYEDSPEVPIEAGSMKSSEVKSITASLCSIYSFGNTVFINNSGIDNAVATVYDLNGKQIMQQNLQTGNNAIEFSLAASAYVVHVKGEQGSISKTVFIN